MQIAAIIMDMRSDSHLIDAFMTLTKPAYREDKAAEAVHYLLGLASGSLDIYNVVKLVYLANRKSLFTRNRAITNDAFASLKWGPVPEDTYDRLRNRSMCSEYWCSLIGPREENRIPQAKREHDYHMLSEADRKIIDETHAEYGVMTFEELKRTTHQFAEWTDPGDSSIVITWSDLLEKNDVPAEHVLAVSKMANLERSLEKLRYTPSTADTR